MTLHILHLADAFDTGGSAKRTVALINAFGNRARHVIATNQPVAPATARGIAKDVRVDFTTDCPPIGGSPSVARYQALARYMRRFDLVLSYDWGAIDAVMARRLFPAGVPMLIHHEYALDAHEAERPRFERNIYRRIALAGAHALVLSSDALAERATKHWKQPHDRVHIVPKGNEKAINAWFAALYGGTAGQSGVLAAKG